MYFAITVHKSQDQSLKIIRVDLWISVFIYDKFYIVLLQITSAQGITVLFSKNNDEKINNIVYLEVLFWLLQT